VVFITRRLFDCWTINISPFDLDDLSSHQLPRQPAECAMLVMGIELSTSRSDTIRRRSAMQVTNTSSLDVVIETVSHLPCLPIDKKSRPMACGTRFILLPMMLSPPSSAISGLPLQRRSSLHLRGAFFTGSAALFVPDAG